MVKKEAAKTPSPEDLESAKVSVRKIKGSSKPSVGKPSSAKPAEGKERPSSAQSRPTSAKGKPKVKPAEKPKHDYLGDVDLPPSDDEEEEDEAVEGEGEDGAADLTDSTITVRGRSATGAALDLSFSEREQRKKEQKEQALAQAAEQVREQALKEDEHAFSVALPSKVAADDSQDPNAKDVKVDGFSVSARGKELLTNTSLTIVHGRRYGLVGPNGKGKSTLLRLLASRQIPVPKNIDVLLVEQEIVGDDRTALEAVVSADEELMRLRAEEARLQALTLRDEDEEGKGGHVDWAAGAEGVAESAEKLNEVYERMRDISAESADARASKILAGLGFTKEMQGAPTRSFSGGWRMRISLARALFVQPTLLLLDEPTNHLDLRAVIWLEEYLMRWKKTLVVVSHDRDFLNSVCTDVIHLFEQKLHFYRGNYDAFDDMYEKKRRENNKLYERFEKQLKAAKQSGSKASQDKVKDRAKYAQERRDKKGKGKGAAAVGGGEEDMVSDVPRKWHDYTVKFGFPEPTELTPPLMQLIDVGFRYPTKKDFGLNDINVGIDMGTRVAIVGPNGAGKSTLLNLIAGDLTPTEGESRRSHKLRIGRYSQHFVDVLTMDENAVQYLLRLHPQQEGPSKSEAMRSKLGKFGLASHNHLTPICKLSGGQKARVVFTSISLSSPHILLLDEPTNHLDMQSIDALAEALEEFSGGVVLVSHDSRLISRVCGDEETSEIWVVENGLVERYDGSFDDYRKELIREIAAELEE